MSIEARNINIKNLNIALQCYGDESKPALLMLHGWLDNSASFSLLAPLMADEYYVVAVDLPGHGQSDHWPQGQHYHLWEAVEHIELIADALKLKSFYLLGHSMGAAMSTLYAGTFSQRIDGLVLIEAFGPMAGDISGAPERLATAISQMKRYEELSIQRPKRDQKAFAQARMQGPMALTQQAADIIVSRGTKETPEGIVWSHDKRLQVTSMMRMSEELIQQFILNIKSPVLGIFASDGLFNQSQIDLRWSALRSEKEMHWFSGGHHLHLEGNVEQVADTIKQFLYNKKQNL
ncbi:alpha/beta hydrolase [Bermanella marisrubri]|uniref:Hydrolase, alpha/beta fold family protein n=1 Tax=Bermanella marisrubri TaxID=207949 RepID=Q1N0M8_9GAMM|nr:alpha/beta hydrolase [Bermanella marisrubri]EAT11805.1 hydrolase, alpha/beta fold family protein [Oceanobacter sp. RED65] [Bermanella marisrubri]QIZ83840.1 alpha/beta hydrolase [Bermanella marisrubri]